MIDLHLYERLVHFKPIWEQYPYQDGEDNFPRVNELSNDDERLIARCYQDWRISQNSYERVDLWCDECLNEAFNRLMTEVIEFEKANFVKS